MVRIMLTYTPILAPNMDFLLALIGNVTYSG